LLFLSLPFLYSTILPLCPCFTHTYFPPPFLYRFLLITWLLKSCFICLGGNKRNAGNCKYASNCHPLFSERQSYTSLQWKQWKPQNALRWNAVFRNTKYSIGSYFFVSLVKTAWETLRATV
jgi:hypothetical protein